jgi:hypothetical protein
MKSEHDHGCVFRVSGHGLLSYRFDFDTMAVFSACLLLLEALASARGKVLAALSKPTLT